MLVPVSMLIRASFSRFLSFVLSPTLYKTAFSLIYVHYKIANCVKFVMVIYDIPAILFLSKVNIKFIKIQKSSTRFSKCQTETYRSFVKLPSVSSLSNLIFSNCSQECSSF